MEMALRKELFDVELGYHNVEWNIVFVAPRSKEL